jgi:uncharacterized membrane protein
MSDLIQDSGAVMGLLVLVSLVAAVVKLWQNNREEQEKKKGS